MKNFKFYTYSEITAKESEELLMLIKEWNENGTIEKIQETGQNIELINKILTLLEYDEENNTITLNGGTY